MCVLGRGRGQALGARVVRAQPTAVLSCTEGLRDWAVCRDAVLLDLSKLCSSIICDLYLVQRVPQHEVMRRLRAHRHHFVMKYSPAFLADLTLHIFLPKRWRIALLDEQVARL